MTKSQTLHEGQQIQVTITDLTHKGLGVARLADYPIFIPQTLPGELIKAQITHLGQHIGHARAIAIIRPSSERTISLEESEALHSTMPLSHLTYTGQLEFKREQVRRVFRKNSNLDLEIPLPLASDTIFGYRNKAQIPVQMVAGQLTTGIFKAGTHELMPVEDFKIQDPEIDRAILKIRDILRHYQITAYDEQSHTGDVRHIIVRRGQYSGEMMVVLVTRSFVLPHRREIIRDLTAQLPQLVSLIQNINHERTNVILGQQSMVLFGQDHYIDQIYDQRFKISHQSFFQVNTRQAEKLYRVATDFANLKGDEVVVDAYCGIGTLSLVLAKKAKYVYGVEIVSDAIENAKENAIYNHINNVHFEVGMAEDWMMEKQAEGLKVDIVVVDPPRKGLDPSFIHATGRMDPQKIIYVSCNPATQARDIKLLMEGGYQLKQIQPVDMFPMTYHVESVVLMTKRETL